MKREQLGSNEAALNDDFLLPLVDNMIKERQRAVEKINEMFGTDISVDFASSWKVTHQENEKQIALADSIIEQTQTGEADITVENHQGIHDTNTPTVLLNGGEPDEPDEPPEDNEESSEPDEESTEERVEETDTSDEPDEKDGEDDDS